MPKVADEKEFSKNLETRTRQFAVRIIRLYLTEITKFKKIIKYFFSVSPVCPAFRGMREIYSAISQIHSFKLGLNHRILNKYDNGLKRQLQDASGSSMHNIMAMEKSAKRLTVNRTTWIVILSLC